MPFLDHLEELRWRILWSFIAIFAGSIVGFILIVQFEVLDLLINPFYEVMGEEERLIFLSPTEPFFLLLKVGILAGNFLRSSRLKYFAGALQQEDLIRSAGERPTRLILSLFCTTGFTWYLCQY